MKNILSAPVLKVMDLLTRSGYDIRVAGGAVRDGLRGMVPKDIDFATTALPEQVQSIFETGGYVVIPTGLQHGTVTVVADGIPYEITTLRVDQETDGRHAKVEYTMDWKLDASRRDFTMNAMYLTQNGDVIDFFDGQADLKAGRVKFVGDPEKRIQEDYLRILRYFRFRGRIVPFGDPYLKTIAPNERRAIERNAHGLKQISGERIWMEFAKILGDVNGYGVLRLMEELGVFREIGINDFNIGRVVGIRGVYGVYDPVALFVAGTKEMGKNAGMDLLVNRYRVSKEERELAAFLYKHSTAPMDLTTAKLMATEVGKDRMMTLLSMTPNMFREWHVMLDWDVPVFPVRGQDLLNAGMTPGPTVGATLRDLKLIWAKTDFSMNRLELLQMKGKNHDIERS